MTETKEGNVDPLADFLRLVRAGPEERNYNFEKIEFTSIAFCEIVKRHANFFLSGERELSHDDFINLKIGIQKAREYYKAEYQNQEDETKKNEISGKIREIETITNDLTAMLEGKVLSSVTVPDTTGLYKNLILDIRNDVKDESKNISIILNTGLSAFTENPINLAVVAKSSEGKTYLVTKTISKFPRQYVIMLRKASPKTFTRERGVLALRVVNGNSESYETEIKNQFTNEIVSVSAYVEYLKTEIDKDRKDEDESADPKRAKLILNELLQNVYTLVDFRNKILIFLDRPDPALWNEMLSILSHDQEYIVTNFVEGEGKKYVKKVVFRGWPAVIFCTSKDEDFNWKDLETRFQIIEPTMTVKKYTDGVNLAVDKEFGINESVRSDKNSEKLGELIEWLIKNKPNTMTPFPPKKLSDALTGGKVNSGDLMRKIPRLLRHVSMSTLFNVSERVLWHNGEETYIIVAFRDIMSIVFLFDDLEFGASLSGMGTTIYEFLTNVVAPVFTSADDSIAVEQKKIQENFFEYLEQCKDKNQMSHLATTKESFSRYMKDLEKRSYIKRIKDENDKRGWNVISTWSELPEAVSLSERLKKLVTPMEIRDLPNMAYLENRNFTAFLGGQKLVTAHSEIIDNKKIEYPKTLEIIGSAQQYSGYHSITYDLAVTNFNNIVDNGIKTDNTASADKSKNDIAQKPSVSYGVTNFSSDENALKDESRYVLLSILEDINLAAEDGQNYNLRKGDIVHIPEINANLLIKRGWAREIQSQESNLDDEDYEDDEKGSPPSKNNSKSDNKSNEPQAQELKKETTQVPPFQNDGTLGTHGTEFKPDTTNHDVRNEKSNHDERNLNQKSIHESPLTKEEGEESVNLLMEQGVHLNAGDTGVSIYGDKFNIAIPGSYYRQNAETVDRLMKDLWFTKSNTGGLGNVFFSRPLKGGDPK